MVYPSDQSFPNVLTISVNISTLQWMIRELESSVSQLTLLSFFFRKATWACTVWSGRIFFFPWEWNFHMAFEKLFWSMTWEIISTSTEKKGKLGVYQALANSEMHGDQEGLFDFIKNLPGQAHSFLHRMPCGCVKRGTPCVFSDVIFHPSIRWTQDVTGVSRSHFRHSFH